MPKRGERLPETPDALKAFEDYWDMGDDRSLPKLARLYQAKSKSGERVPTRHLAQLKLWSARWGWQARLAQRIIEEATLRRAALRKRTQAHRERLLAAIEVDSGRYIEALRKNGGAMLTEDAASLEKMTRLYFQLADEPLAERLEHTGKDGGPVKAVVATHELSDDRAAQVLEILLDCGALQPAPEDASVAEADEVRSA